MTAVTNQMYTSLLFAFARVFRGGNGKSKSIRDVYYAFHGFTHGNSGNPCAAWLPREFGGLGVITVITIVMNIISSY